jgi:hypothetical protein
MPELEIGQSLVMRDSELMLLLAFAGLRRATTSLALPQAALHGLMEKWAGNSKQPQV